MNIRQIAKAAGVSTATVSRILNNTGYVSEQTRNRVLKIIEENHYVPSRIARSMSGGHTKIVGLMLPDITNPFFPNLARGVEDAASSLGYQVVLCNSDGDLKRQEQYLYMLREQRVDGIIVSSADADGLSDVIKRIHGDTPVVFCDRVPRERHFNTVQTDHYMGARLAVEHLLDLGHRDIVMIAGPSIPSSIERTQAFFDACRESGIAMPESRIVQGDFRAESGYGAMKAILEKTRPTAVFCANDLMAFGAMDAIAEIGLSIPEDISVVGYDNILFAQFTRPPLTTVNQPTYLLGVRAFELLLKVDGEVGGRLEREMLKPNLVVRKSTSPVKGTWK